jgi:hypothetical protein
LKLLEVVFSLQASLDHSVKAEQPAVCDVAMLRGLSAFCCA